MTMRTRRARALGVVGALLLIAGAATIVIAVRAQRSAPQPPRSAASPVSVIPTTTPSPGGRAPGSSSATVPGPSGASHGGRSASATRGPVLPRSAPTRLRIPAIDVDSTLRTIGLDSAGAIATPPLVRDSHAYWLTVSPTPGQVGPATIIGHVDSSAYGPGVFFELGEMRQRDKIYITRADGLVAMFEVERVAEYEKDAFPTQQVYGNLDHAGLRLITCGGSFDPSIHSYESNIVVYASLVSAGKS